MNLSKSKWMIYLMLSPETLTNRLPSCLQVENGFSSIRGTSTFSVSPGQPLPPGVPAISGHLSFASSMPSLSRSLSGQPSLLIGPFISGHLSNLSAMPSPSRSKTGQPLLARGPRSKGQASRLSVTPSASASGAVIISFLSASFFRLPIPIYSPQE